MGLEVTSLKVLLFVDDLPEEFHNFSKREIMAFIQAIKRLWPTNMHEKYWFDVEIVLCDRIDGLWSFGLRVACYRFPDKNTPYEIPRNILDQVLDRKIQIDPIILGRYPNDEARLNDLRRYRVEVMHVYE